MYLSTLWQYAPTGETSFVETDFDEAYGDGCYEAGVTRIEVTADDPRWVEAVQREHKRLGERTNRHATIFVASSYENAARTEYDDWMSASCSLSPHGCADEVEPDGTCWQETARQVSCDSDEWRSAVTNEMASLKFDGLVAA
ncbi:hypothetical protein FNH13_17735 [Ornithinimicrobium ciconiae]|uniref:Uncharacterized protein n=1 Tax=Ornithinimicrobium ciconiae TaxID=2594265 RepID=A0A516GEI9_9MICO|nr:hypothetical protein [Ornithinimicrobium ciconiae]QDO89942.1 hypothetical protein FNH13_17735 [Ornithinimicrobium ciconiae]